jgi:alpha-beta hydrolase superfamily lysophospholipase
LFPIPYLDSASALRKLSCPVLIFHGENDAEVRAAHSRDLFTCANWPKELTILPHTSHEEIAPEDFDLYMSSLERYIGQFQPVAPKAIPSLALV